MARMTPEDQIAALERKIQNIKKKAEEKRLKANPAVKHIRAALKAVDQGMASCSESAIHAGRVAGRHRLVHLGQLVAPRGFGRPQYEHSP